MKRSQIRAIVRSVTAILVLLSLAGIAAADRQSEKRAAENLYRSGMTHYNLREYTAALADFKEGYRALPRPEFLFNIAQCHRMLGNFDESEATYRTYLREYPDAPNRVEVERLIVEMSDQTKRKIANQPPPGTMPPSERPATTPPSEKPATATAPVEKNPPPSVAPATSPTVVIVEAPARRHHVPVYKRWWLWTTVAVAAVAIGVGLGIGLSQTSTTYPTANTALGTFRW